MKVLVTGASGFVGSALVSALSAGLAHSVVAVHRKPANLHLERVRPVLVEGLTEAQDWTSALRNVDVVVHCAARVHVMDDASDDPLREFRKINVDGTLSLARQAAAAGVQRFIFLSSIKVNGELTELGKPFASDQPPAPLDPYGISKFEAEEGLRSLTRETGMELISIRPPLVYGPGVKANFLAMMKWLWRGVPLPLGGVTENRRSLVALDNLVDLIVTCIDHPAAANQTFLVSDDEDLSTAGLLLRMGNALGRPARLIPAPPKLLMLGAKLIGRPGVAQRLCGSLQVDISKTKELLGWSPPVSVDEALRKTADSWLKMETARLG
jgi:nucleoside-diphosphate-sugar epimerase